jgi:hypothetical protein
VEEAVTKRDETPNRYRVARSDASVKSIEKRIEKDYGLPPGSVQINKSGGKNARSDAKIETIRKDHRK